MTRNNIIKFPGKMRLKFVPSRARYYIRCPYFLYLSNMKDIYIPYPQIASRKGNFFEGVVLDKVSGQAGHEISRANQVTDILNADGLYTLSKRVDTEFYAGENIGFKVGILKPDLILSERAGSGFQITVLEIKNCDRLMPYHYLQAYVYKLTLERFLSQRTGMPVHVEAGMIHLREDFFSKDESEADFGTFREKIAAMNMNSLVIKNFVNLESEMQKTLGEIASLQANITECGTCPGAEKCERSLWDGLK